MTQEPRNSTAGTDRSPSSPEAYWYDYVPKRGGVQWEIAPDHIRSELDVALEHHPTRLGEDHRASKRGRGPYTLRDERELISSGGIWTNRQVLAAFINGILLATAVGTGSVCR